MHLDLSLTLLKHKSSTAFDQETTDWCKIVEDKVTYTHYNNLLLAATNADSMLYKDFHKKIKKAGEDMVHLVKSKVMTGSSLTKITLRHQSTNATN